MPRYKVMVDDNFHYQDAGGRREHGTYENLEEALAACCAVVDRSLENEFRLGISAEDLYGRYVSFGEDIHRCYLNSVSAVPPIPGIAATDRSTYP